MGKAVLLACLLSLSDSLIPGSVSSALTGLPPVGDRLLSVVGGQVGPARLDKAVEVAQLSGGLVIAGVTVRGRHPSVAPREPARVRGRLVLP